jgi:hypothetical protein
MKLLGNLSLFAAAAFTLGSARAEDVKLTGVMSCAKCNLKTADACADVLQVGDVTYLLEEGGKRKTSGHVCSGAEDKTVTGKVEERDGQKYLLVSAIADAGKTAAAPAETKLQGVMSCEKCNLGTADACADTLKVGDVLYRLEEGGSRKTSQHQCSGTANATVTGKVEERGGEKFVVVSSIVKE